jgi:hypothetical protein
LSTAAWFRCLLLTHRYLGIAVGWLLVLWCLSGLVMIYVSYPYLPQPQRYAALAPLQLSRCCPLTADTFAADERMAAISVEMLAGHPVLQLQPEVGATAVLDLSSDQRTPAISAALALQVADAYLAAHGRQTAQPPTLSIVAHDQWTVAASFDPHRPLYLVAANDSAGTQLYVSHQTGQLVQVTTRSQRFWNWLGAVPHWLYFTALRQHVAIWAQVVIWSSVAGAFLAAFGLYLGVHQLRAPYRGLNYWHHVPGLVFGVLVLSWVFSGLLSMNPWGWLESQQQDTIAHRLSGEHPTWQTVQSSLQALSVATLPGDAVRIDSSTLNGQLHFLVTTRSGARSRLDARWMAAPLAEVELQSIRHALGEQATLASLEREDNYYYSLGDDRAALPVLRVMHNDTGATRSYLDPMSGELLLTVDRNVRWYRWLHSALHRMDFAALWRNRPFRDLWLWLALGGASVVCVTGTWLGLRRLRGGH